MRSWWLFSFVAAALVLGLGRADHSGDTHEELKEALLDFNLKMSWVVNSLLGQGTVDFSVTLSRSEGWFAVGVSPSRIMAGSTVVVCSSGETDVFEWKLTGHTQPSLDPTQNIAAASCTVTEDDSLVLKFTRPYVTSDSTDPEINTNGTTPIIWAWGDTSTPSYHSARGVADVNFASGKSEAVSLPGLSKAIVAHGALMIIAWGFIFPIGISIPIFDKAKFSKWMELHRALQCIGAAAVVVGFFCAVGGVNEKGGEHFDATHNILGLVITLAVIQQVVNGAMRPHAPESGAQPTLKRRAWFAWHRFAALVVFCLAVVNMFIGASEVSEVPEFYKEGTAFLAVYIVAFLSLLAAVAWRLYAKKSGDGNNNKPIALGDGMNDL